MTSNSNLAVQFHEIKDFFLAFIKWKFDICMHSYMHIAYKFTFHDFSSEQSCTVKAAQQDNWVWKRGRHPGRMKTSRRAGIGFYKSLEI